MGHKGTEILIFAQCETFQNQAKCGSGIASFWSQYAVLCIRAMNKDSAHPQQLLRTLSCIFIIYLAASGIITIMSSLTAWQNASPNALIPRERSVFAPNDLSCCHSNEVTDCTPLAPHACYTITARSKMVTWLAGCHMPQKHGSADSDLLISLTSPGRWEISELVRCCSSLEESTMKEFDDGFWKCRQKWLIYVYQLINTTREGALLLFVIIFQQQIPDGTTRTQKTDCGLALMKTSWN